MIARIHLSIQFWIAWEIVCVVGAIVFLVIAITTWNQR